MNLRHCQAVLGGPKFEGPRQQPLQPQITADPQLLHILRPICEAETARSTREAHCALRSKAKSNGSCRRVTLSSR